MSIAYTCNPPFGLKATLDGGVMVANASPATPGGNASSGSSGANSSQSIVPGMGPVCGISVITSMGSNSGTLCEGPPTPTQELDLSGSALEQQQLAAAAAAATASSLQLQAAQQAQQQRKCMYSKF